MPLCVMFLVCITHAGRQSSPGYPKYEYEVSLGKLVLCLVTSKFSHEEVGKSANSGSNFKRNKTKTFN